MSGKITRAIATVHTRAADEPENFTFVASTDAVDHYGDIIEQGGWDLSVFKSNPVILWMHSHWEPIGKAVDFGVRDGRLVSTVSFGRNATAQRVKTDIEDGLIHAASVGFYPIELEELKDAKGKWTGGFKFTKSLLLEISVVSVPANPEALMAGKGFERPAEERALLSKLPRVRGVQLGGSPVALAKRAIEIESKLGVTGFRVQR